jgi:8-oxo-dGTP pyrophosphatase MutT (NUDIX family)
MSDAAPSLPQPAATVVLMRDCGEGPEVLLVRRSSGLDFLGGAWVFPGGRIDPEDYLPDAPADRPAAARRAAVREAAEEAGLTIAEEQLIPLSRWIAPEGLPRRFDAWFFVAPAAGEAVCVDGMEIHDHRWMRAEEAIAAQYTGEIMLAPPTFVTLIHLSRYRSVNDALSALRNTTAETFNPRIRAIPGGACALYAGDAAYEGGELETVGPRHRLWILASGWRYERTD